MKISSPTHLRPLCTYRSDTNGKFIVLDVDSYYVSIYSVWKRGIDRIPFEEFSEAEFLREYTLFSSNEIGLGSIVRLNNDDIGVVVSAGPKESDEYFRFEVATDQRGSFFLNSRGVQKEGIKSKYDVKEVLGRIDQEFDNHSDFTTGEIGEAHES